MLLKIFLIIRQTESIGTFSPSSDFSFSFCCSKMNRVRCAVKRHFTMFNHWVWLIIMNDDAFPVNGIDLIAGIAEKEKKIICHVRNRKPSCFQEHTITHTLKRSNCRHRQTGQKTVQIECNFIAIKSKNCSLFSLSLSHRIRFYCRTNR